MFDQLKVRARLLLILLISCVAVLSVGLIGFIGLQFSEAEIHNVYEGGVHSLALLDVTKSQTFHLLLGNASTKEREDLATSWNAYLQNSGDVLDSNQKEKQALVDKIQQLLDQKNEASLRETLPVFDQLIKVHIQDSQQDYQTALNVSWWLKLSLFLFLLAIYAILIPLTMKIIQSVIQPLNYATDRIVGLGIGDTKMQVEVISGGELGLLLEAIRNTFLFSDRMSAALAAIAEGDVSSDTPLRSEKDDLGRALGGLVTKMRQIIDQIKTIATGDLTAETLIRSDKDALGKALNDMAAQMRLIIGQIKGEVNVLASSSEEILVSLSHLSLGASSEASAVTETTTTIEELKQTANISVSKAKDVLANAEETLQTVAASERSVSITIEDMNQIRDRMQIISDRILKLSEKGLAIAAIMDTVNEIAEQSNLLAVNAAIEAAKAGEVGFSVVAQEMRTLAEQSKGATIQVKALLGDIQHATSEAVLATEQGSKAVAKGVEQSMQTSQAIKELADKMVRVKKAADQIVLSNQEQLIGTEQITFAMTQISQTTNEHVEHLKQIETAVMSLNEVGNSLKGLTDRYKVPMETLANAVKIPQAPKHKPELTGTKR